MILGIVSEADELMEQINWKAHTNSVSRSEVGNIEIEIADLMKYVLSLAELWGMNSDTLAFAVMQKTEELFIKRTMNNWSPSKKPILITDMDGTLADWRASFIRYVKDMGFLPLEDTQENMSIETSLGITYDTYLKLKRDFESSGHYQQLLPIPEAIDFVRDSMVGSDLVVFTARPAKTLKRIWWDSWLWLQSYGITPKILRIGNEERIEYALLQKSKGHEVLMFDDNPHLAFRAAMSDIDVILKTTPYNHHVQHKNIIRFEDFQHE